jgi:hypothetical protein
VVVNTTTEEMIGALAAMTLERLRLIDAVRQRDAEIGRLKARVAELEGPVAEPVPEGE